VGAGLFMAAAAQRLRRQRRISNLKEILDSAYREESPAATHGPAEISKLLGRGGVLAERALARTGFLKSLKSKVERSGWKLGAGEFVVVSGALALAGAVVGSALMGSAALAVLLALGGLAAPLMAVNHTVGRKKSMFEEQLPGILDLMSASLESGTGVTQALELVVGEAGEPAATEFARVLSAMRLGAPLVDALRALSARLDSRDLAWTLQAIVVQQRTGGPLAGVLRTVAEFMRSREEVRREVRALTAEGRLSAYILGGLPFLLAVLMLVVNPDYLNILFRSPVGLVMVAGTVVLMSVAFLVMHRIVQIEV
ncbi:MAG: type II secretion system F family protein, partial [Acidimicrobiales bacterium]